MNIPRIPWPKGIRKNSDIKRILLGSCGLKLPGNIQPQCPSIAGPKGLGLEERVSASFNVDRISGDLDITRPSRSKPKRLRSDSSQRAINVGIRK